MTALPKQYQPKEYEPATYQQWEKSGAFTADNTTSKEAFSMSMPPPNATGQLHIGHALFLSIQDALARYQRMQGKEVLWLPGTDHAAIATESVVIGKLRGEGIKNPRQELGREELVKRIAQYVESSRDTIRGQIRSMGASCDWSRERYTLEPALSAIVELVFKKMYEDGLIYRGSRIVNWDPNLQTTVSDDEVERRAEQAPFYTLQYGPFKIGTARPETKFGDKYVVMHPDDERYKKYQHGDTFEAEWINGPVTATVIKDQAADPEFGTGVMTITPWHDATDFEIAQRHSLDKEQIIDFEGKLLPIAGEFAGLPITEARPKIVEKLREKGLLKNIDEKYVHNSARNSRGKGVIEPQIKLQWFVDVNKRAVSWQGKQLSLKEVMQQTVRSGDIKILPQRFEKMYFHWIDNLRDWCISRQIWWGHRIPVWYRGEEVHVGTPPPGASDGWQQDPDTLDTWFSTGLWTWSTLIDPKLTQNRKLSLTDLLAKSPDYRKFHPTSLMETGFDILFFWVARMILMTTYATGHVPFKEVYLNGLVTAITGKKMSKSDPDSMVDPLETIEEFGSDATRFGLLYQLNYSSQTIKFDQEAIKAARNFANKIWNVARLLQTLPEKDHPTLADQWIEGRLSAVAKQATELIESYKLGDAAHLLHDFVWNDFADWYIEILKVEGSTATARRVFSDTLKLLHPFLPHLTEVLWEHFGQGSDQLLITTAWPKAKKSLSLDKEELEATMSRFQDIVTTVRSARALLEIPPATVIELAAVSPPLPEALQALSRSQLVARATEQMKVIPLAHGSTVALNAPEITPASIKHAQQKLAKAEKELRQFTKELEATVARMKGKAPQQVVTEKEALIRTSKDKLHNLQQSKKWLS